MSYELEKSYISRVFESFQEWFTENEDLVFTYFLTGLIFNDLDSNNIDDDIIVDGAEDKQIDVVYLVPEKNEINILQIKKSNKNFSSNTIIQISNWLDWFLERDIDEIKKLSNIKLKNKILEARDQENFQWWEWLKITVYYCNLADSDNISKEASDELERVQKKYTNFYPKFSFKLFWAKDIYKAIKSHEKIDIDDDILDYDSRSVIKNDLDDTTKSLVLTVSTNEIARLVQTHWNNLFEQNIRFSLWDNKVNKKIYKTVTWDSSNLFWYFNNGITIICDSFSEISNPGNYSIKLKNLQIVNGCQTSTTLHKAYTDNLLKKSYVLVKIYSSKDEEFINNITEATNSQSSINNRDLAANDKYQKLIQDNLWERGYYYERKRNQYKWKKINLSKKINNERLWQAVMSIILKKPSKARSSKWVIFDSYYEEVFSKSIEQLLLAYLIFDFSERKKKSKKLTDELKTEVVVYWTFHISRIMWAVMFDDGIFSNKTDMLEKLILGIESNEDFLEQYYTESLNILLKIVEEHNKEEEIFSITNYFKRWDTDSYINKKLKDVII